MDTNTRTELAKVISPELVAKMDAAQTATSERCPICRVGRGRFCEHRQCPGCEWGDDIRQHRHIDAEDGPAATCHEHNH